MSAAQPPRVLITGAACGFGFALVRQFVRRGACVLATDILPEPPSELADLDSVSYLRLDVTQDADWAHAHEWVAQQWARLDFLFNSAGVAAGGRIEFTEIDEWRWIIDINLLGVVRGCRMFIPMMKSQRSGHIVNIASAAGLVHPPGMTEYAAVKAGVVAMSESLFHELQSFGVLVSVVCPTFFRTNLAQSLRGGDESWKQTTAKMINTARASADEVAVNVLRGVDR